VRRLHPELWQQNNRIEHHDKAPSHISFSTRELLMENNTNVIPQTFYFSLFPRLKIKLKGRHFDTTEVIEAESQAELNNLTEHDFQNALKNWQNRWER
jgi:hypothetical protein